MPTIVENKYYLKSVHEEIDLIDRKLAHITKHESFDSDSLRDAATKKLVTKRESLAQTAKRLVSEGIEFKPSDLPRSFRPVGEAAQSPTGTVTANAAEKVEAAPQGASKHGSPYAGTSLDWEQSVAEYLQRRTKA